MSETADILIIGGGVMGTSIAYRLAKQTDERVVLLERQAVCSALRYAPDRPLLQQGRPRESRPYRRQRLAQGPQRRR